MALTIALIGDFNKEVIAHMAIPQAIEISANVLQFNAESHWVDTDRLRLDELKSFDAIWCVPASPYKSMEGALTAIRYARENHVPFLGTCGGYQHAALEYARNILGYPQAGNSEVDPDTKMPLISSLVCKLVEKSDHIILRANSKVNEIYKIEKILEDYHCSFGVNPDYLPLYDQSDMKFVGFDELGDPRVLELENHPFFIATAFQPERSANNNEEHPLITSFLKAVADSKVIT